MARLHGIRKTARNASKPFARSRDISGGAVPVPRRDDSSQSVSDLFLEVLARCLIHTTRSTFHRSRRRRGAPFIPDRRRHFTIVPIKASGKKALWPKGSNGVGRREATVHLPEEDLSDEILGFLGLL